MQLKPIQHQVVVVMGASSGIGRETALRFARRGAKVVVAARSEPGLRSLVEEIQRAGGDALAAVADVTEFEQVRGLADTAVERFGRLDTWVHLAAVSLYAPFERTKPEEFKRIIDVNLTGQAYGAMAALPHLKRTGRGALIHVSSVESQISLPFTSAYAASKHGITGFLDALRLELQHEGIPISVTNVMPASINTPFFNKARTKLGVKPMGIPPIYQPGVVADVILHAAEHPTRDIVAGGAGKMMLLTQRLAPRLLDALLLRTAFKGQKTNEPKPESAPNNLYGPVGGYDRVEGDFSAQAHATSVANWLDLHPTVSQVIAGAALGTVAVMAAVRAVRDGD